VTETRRRPDARADARWNERAIEQLIGRLLQLGVLIAASVVVIGGAGLLLQHGAAPADFHTFRGATEPLRDIGSILRAARRLDSRAIVQLGLVLLILTPVARVALTLVAFLVRRDRLYAALSLVVLMLLIYGLVWGRA
jgi:uncharacterized membrane protein